MAKAMGEASIDAVYNEQKNVRRMSTNKSMKSRMSVLTFRSDKSIIEEQKYLDDFGDEDESAFMVFKNVKADVWGNLIVSMYWEEKLVLFIKFYQFLGFTVMVFFE